MDTDRSIRAYALTGGLGLLAMAVLAPLVQFGVLQNPANLPLSPGSLRAAALGMAVVGILDAVVAWAVYGVFRGTDRGLALLTTGLRGLYAAVLLAAVAGLAGDGVQVRTFQAGWDLGLLVFGVHLVALGALLIRSGNLRWVLGILVAVSGLGYLTDSTVKFLSPGAFPAVATWTFGGEVVFMVWLLVVGIRGLKA